MERAPAPVVVVTGANQGLGLAIVTAVATRTGPGSTVYLTGRDADRVDHAAAALARDGISVTPAVLDVTDDAGVASFADRVARRHGGVDVVISNAAARITPDRPASEQVRSFVATNNLGTTRVLRAFVPLLRDGGRLLVVASSFGTLRSMPAHLHHRFDGPSLTLDALDATMSSFVEDVEQARTTAGWPEWINVPSKVGQVAAVRVVAREVAPGRDVLVAAVCPGLVDTAASRPWFADMSAAQRPDVAAAHVLPLALDPIRPGDHGELVQFGRVLPWS